eukprot:3645290-Prymnesium_polylepis.1
MVEANSSKVIVKQKSMLFSEKSEWDDFMPSSGGSPLLVAVRKAAPVAISTLSDQSSVLTFIHKVCAWAANLTTCARADSLTLQEHMCAVALRSILNQLVTATMISTHDLLATISAGEDQTSVQRDIKKFSGQHKFTRAIQKMASACATSRWTQVDLAPEDV